MKDCTTEDARELEEFLIEARASVARVGTPDMLKGDKMILENAIEMLADLIRDSKPK